jgi:hypothetical protein
MINHVYVHSLFSLSVTRTYIQSIIHAYNERKREKESACNSRKWEGLINSVCSRRRKCWMTFVRMDSIYRQAQEWDNDWHLSHIRYVMKITQMICRRHTQVPMKKCTYIYIDDVLILTNGHICRELFFQSNLIRYKVDTMIAFIKIHLVTTVFFLFVVQ